MMAKGSEMRLIPRARPAPQARPAITTFRVSASHSDIQAGLAEIRAFLAGGGLSGDDCGTVEIVLAEALNNVAEHAYAMVGAGSMSVTIALGAKAATIDILDAGSPLPYLRLPPGRPPILKPPNDSLPETGFGWFLIRSLSSGLSYARRRGQNHLRLHLTLANWNGCII